MAGGPGRQRPRGLKPGKNTGKTFVRLMKILMEKYGVHLIIVAVCIIINTIATLQGKLFLRDLLDVYIEPMLFAIKNGEAFDPTTAYLPLRGAIIRVAVFYILGTVAAYAYNRIMVTVTQGTLKHFRDLMFAKMEKLPIRFFDTHPHGDIMSLYTNDTDTLRQMISQALPQIFSSVIMLVGTTISMLVLSPVLTLVTFVMVALMFIITGAMSKKSGKYFMKQQKDIADVNGYVEEMLEGQKVVKVFNYEETNIEHFRERNQALFDSAFRANWFSSAIMPVNAQLSNVSYVLCAVLGGLMAITGFLGFSLGGLASFLTLNRGFAMPINQISMQFNTIIMALAGMERIFALLDEEEEVDDGYVTLVNAKREGDNLVPTKERTGLWAWEHKHQNGDPTTYVELKGEVVFDDVDFGYTDEKMVLHNIILHAKQGQKIAFVGSTGAGKTTITNLINRFYDIQDGKIRYDGININKMKKADLRRSLGIVLQDTNLFTMTVRENIRYGRLDATDEEVEAAAKLANAHGFIRRLPQGYDTVLTGNGANLSQGQRQLIAIARAAIADPPVLILDEATSSIDTRTERLIQDGMDKLMSGRTTFVIAHRLSTIKNSDCIIVMEDGRIVERGNHEELMAQKGKYYRLNAGA